MQNEGRKKLLESWKRQQQLLNTIWMWRLYADASQIGDDEAMSCIAELVDDLSDLGEDVASVTGSEE